MTDGSLALCRVDMLDHRPETTKKTNENMNLTVPCEFSSLLMFESKTEPCYSPQTKMMLVVGVKNSTHLNIFLLLENSQ